MKQHITITLDIDTAAAMKLQNLSVFPANCGISREDVLDMLDTSIGFQKYCTKEPTSGLIVSGSRTIEDWSLVDNILYSKVFEQRSKDKPIPTLILNSTPGVVFRAQSFANLHSLKTERITPDWEHIGNLAGGVCALDMIDALSKYDNREVLLIWDEYTTEVPYFIEPAIKADIDLFVYSTKQNDWLSVEQLKEIMSNYEERVDRCRIIQRNRK